MVSKGVTVLRKIGPEQAGREPKSTCRETTAVRLSYLSRRPFKTFLIDLDRHRRHCPSTP